MPKRNHLPQRPDVIEISEKSQKYFVQKQKSLMLLQDTPLDLYELKLLDLYLSKLDNFISKQEKSDEKISSQRTITIGNGDLERTLGLTHINKTTLEPHLKALMMPFEVSDKNNENELELIHLFETVHAVKGVNRQWTVTFEMSKSAEKHIFIPENIHYLKYRLMNVVNLTSRYSYFLYMYLEDERHKHNDWKVPLEELKAILGCTSQSRYQEYKYFNREVLIKAQKEIAERTNCRFTYEQIRRSRTVVGIQFHLEPQIETKYTKPLEQISFDDLLEDGEPIDLVYSGRDVDVFRLMTENTLVKDLNDATIEACFRVIDYYYGSVVGEDERFDYDAQMFTTILDKVAMEIEKKKSEGKQIADINAYVHQAVKNYPKEN